MFCDYETWHGRRAQHCHHFATWSLIRAPHGTARPEREKIYLCTLHKNRYEKRLLEEAWIVTQGPQPL